MATTTPNYGWDVPTSTDYVKDGATAIETLGDDIDASLYSITNGQDVGLSHIVTSSFSGASTHAVNNVFTSTYQNYRVMVNIDSVSGSNVQLSLRLRASGTDVTTNYRSSRIFLSAASTVAGGQDPLGTDEFLITGANSTGQGTAVGAIDLFYPQETKTSGYLTTAHNYTGAISQTQLIMGQLNNTTSYDGFNLLITSGTITGSVSVYGYRK
jgi:hypothetical protein